MTNLCANSYMIAGNESDFQNVFDFQSDSKTEEEVYTDVAKRCFGKFANTKLIAISNRRSISATQNQWNGYLFIRDEVRPYYKSMTYMLDSIQDRVGTGDSFVAGIIFGVLNNKKCNYQEIIDFAVTLAALNHTTSGDASRFSEEDVMQAFKAGGAGRIIR